MSDFPAFRTFPFKQCPASRLFRTNNGIHNRSRILPCVAKLSKDDIRHFVTTYGKNKGYDEQAIAKAVADELEAVIGDN